MLVAPGPLPGCGDDGGPTVESADASGSDAIGASDTTTSADASADVLLDGVSAGTGDAIASSDVDAASVEATAADAFGPDTGDTGDDVTVTCPEGASCQLASPLVCMYGLCNAAGACVPTPLPGCCTQQSDCDGVVPLHACDDILCDSGVCTAFRRPGCCADGAECDDGFACTTDACSYAGGACSHCPIDCACPAATSVFETGFDAESMLALSITVSDEQPSDDITWQVDSARWVRPPTSAYVGDPTCRTYFSGSLGIDCQPVASNAQKVRVSFFTPTLPLPDVPGGHVALFWVLADVEPPETGALGEADVLVVTVEEPTTGASHPVLSTLDVGKSTSGAWRLLSADLSPWAGQSILLRFTFDTLDGTDNHHEGVYVDELVIVPRCLGGCCETDADCVDQLEVGACDVARCVALTDSAGSVCAALPAEAGVACTACGGDADCADDNPCTADTCSANGTCEHVGFCCFEAIVLQDGFEAGLEGWFVDDEDPTDPVTWQTVTSSAIQGAASAWLGDPATGTYAAPDADGDGEGEVVLASLTTSGVTLPPLLDDDGAVAASFWLRLETEWDGTFYDNPLGIDRLSVQVVTGLDLTEVFSSDDIGGTTGGLWQKVTLDLGPWAGQGVQLRFTFDTLDGNANAFPGLYIDDVRLGRFCN